MKPTSRDDQESELKTPLVMVPSKQQEPETENTYEPTRGMEKLE